MTSERLWEQLVTLLFGLRECLGLLGIKPNIAVKLRNCWICCVAGMTA